MPSVIVQKEKRASVSPIVRPVIFGNHQCSAAKPPKTDAADQREVGRGGASVVFFRLPGGATSEC